MVDAHLHAAAAVVAEAAGPTASAAAIAAALAAAAVASGLDVAGVPAVEAAPAVVAAAAAAASVAAAAEQSAAAGGGSDAMMHQEAEHTVAAAAVKAFASDFGGHYQDHMWSSSCHSTLLSQNESSHGPELRWGDCFEDHMLRCVACHDCQKRHQERQKVKHGGMPHTLLDP